MRKLTYEEFLKVYDWIFEKGVTDFEKMTAYEWWLAGRRSVRLGKLNEELL